MVYLRRIIEEKSNFLLRAEGFEVYWYYYLRNPEKLNHIIKDNYSYGENISICGYCSKEISSEKVNKLINKPPIRGIDFTSNIFKFLGIYLVASEKLYDRLLSKFENTDLKYKYVIALIENKLQEEFLKYVEQNWKTSKGCYEAIFQFLFYDNQLELDQFLFKVIENESFDVVDLFILQEVERVLIEQDCLTINKFNNLSSIEIVRQVLNHFDNSVKKITGQRREGHNSFVIRDEYDVQDILYVVLKSIFPKLKQEEPTPSVGGSFNKIDFILEEEGILIEVKMIKESDGNEKKFINELKLDIQSYYEQASLQNLVFFVYDPYKKSRDNQNFYDLNSTQKINGKEFQVEVIVI